MWSDDTGWAAIDHRGSASWRAARDAARAAGGDLTPLMDMHPVDREIRLQDMARSNVPGERIRALDELIGLLDPDALSASLCDAPWTPLQNAGPCLVLHGWHNGHVMVVRESGSRPGTYYPVVDGHHLSWRGGPETYANLRDAMAAAEAAASWPVGTFIGAID